MQQSIIRGLAGCLMAVIGNLIAACSLLAAEQAQIPAPLLGQWVIDSVQGADPAFLEVARAHDLVGRRISISRSRITLWSVYTGIPSTVSMKRSTLGELFNTPASVRSSSAFSEDSRPLDYYEVGFLDCANDGKPVANGCPGLVFARDPLSGDVSLVTVPWGFAHLHRPPG